jgi:peptidoglycan/LPS O-acetylase OafA/YrhL
MLIFWAAFTPVIRMHRWGEYGDFSYGLYLWGYPIQQIMVSILGTVSPLVLCLYALPTAILAGIISWHVIEKRFLHRKPVRTTPPLVAAPVLVEVAT